MENYLYYDLNHPNRFGPFLERWKNVPGFELYYSISDYGRCKSLKREILYKNNVLHIYDEKILSKKNSRKKDWYIQYVFCIGNKVHYKTAHSLVANLFIPNPENKPEVNHKDGIKENTFIGNLEWVTASENHIHAFRMGLQWCYQSRLILDTSTGIYFDNIRIAEKDMGFYKGKLQRMINGHTQNTTNLICV